MRFLIPDRATFQRSIQALAVVCVVQGAFMVSEQFTFLNVFTPSVRIRPRSGRVTFDRKER